MTRSSMAAAGVACAVVGALAGAAVATAQSQSQPQTYQVSPIPVPASDTLKVMGGVEVTNVPTVLAQQLGHWTVTMADPVAMAPRPPAFLTAGERYAVTWPSGKSDTVRILQARPDGWVQIDAAPGTPEGARWINPAMATQIQQLGR